MINSIYELKTRNGRAIRVAIENKNQEQRLFKKFNEGKANKNEEEQFISISSILNGIHDINAFEKFADSLHN